MNRQAFLKSFVPFFLSFLSVRLVLQTDLVMLSRFGESALAAFGLPLRIMILDMILAFALAPVISVRVAAANDKPTRAREISRALQVTSVVSVIVALIGLVVYPPILAKIAPTEEVRGLAQDAVFWLTLSIPFRMLHFAASMSLHGLGRGLDVLKINVTQVLANFLLNLFFLNVVEMGFAGPFVGTLVGSVLNLLWALWFLRDHLHLPSLRTVDFGWVRQFFCSVGYEVLRLTSDRVVGMLIVTLVSLHHFRGDAVARLGSFTAGMELLLLAAVPSLAAMRALAVNLSPMRNSRSASELMKIAQPVFRVAAAVAVVIGLIVAVFGQVLGERYYQMGPDTLLWWRPFVLSFCVLIPLRTIHSLQLGVAQAKGMLRAISIVDVSMQWLVVVPVLVVGLALFSPWLAWSSFVIAEAIGLLLLWRMLRLAT